MKAKLIAATSIVDFNPLEEVGYEPHNEWYQTDADELAEFAGRLCYESWDRPNPATASNSGYIANIMEHKHFSVLEHSSATFLFTGVSRALTHELVRHRHFSFSQVSQRYVDHSGRAVVYHPSLDGRERLMVADAAQRARDVYETLARDLRARGVDKKTANGAARSVLPEGTETKIVVTGNHRSWLEFIDKRNSKYADPEIRELAKLIIPQLKMIAPNIYANVQPTEEEVNPVGTMDTLMLNGQSAKPQGWYMA